MATFKVDSESVTDSIEALRKLLSECEDAYSKNIPESAVDKGLMHNELDILCRNIKTSWQYMGELVNNTILFLGQSSEMFDTSDQKSASAISDYTIVASSTGVAVGALSKYYTVGSISEKPTNTVNIGDYSSKATDTEYARLCYLVGKIKDKENPEIAFHNLLVGDLPENDPLKCISDDQISVIEYGSGFKAIVISDGDNAIVIFAGTEDGDMGDYLADAKLAIPNPFGRTEQAKQASDLINKLSREHSNIVVTGHSLGGYLATSVTLQDDTISKCIAFDPPGRYDVKNQIKNNTDRVAKVTTYEAKGSYISSVGRAVGKVKRLEVEKNGDRIIDKNHGIKQICDAMGGKKAIENSWK